MGSNDTTYLIRSHLGAILKAGDQALGYDLKHTIMHDEDLDLSVDSIPDVILVKKQFEKPAKPTGKKFRKKKRGVQNPSEHFTEAKSELEDFEEDQAVEEDASGGELLVQN